MTLPLGNGRSDPNLLVKTMLVVLASLDGGGNLFTAFALDQSLCSSRIREASKKGFFLADGYFTTNLAYQVFINKVATLDQALQLAAWLDLPRPDLAIYIDLSPKTAFARKASERGHDEGPDVYEKDLMFQTELRTAFKRMCREQIYCRWQEVDGEGSLEEVTEAILSILQPRGGEKCS